MKRTVQQIDDQYLKKERVFDSYGNFQLMQDLKVKTMLTNGRKHLNDVKQ